MDVKNGNDPNNCDNDNKQTDPDDSAMNNEDSNDASSIICQHAEELVEEEEISNKTIVHGSTNENIEKSNSGETAFEQCNIPTLREISCTQLSNFPLLHQVFTRISDTPSQTKQDEIPTSTFQSQIVEVCEESQFQAPDINLRDTVETDLIYSDDLSAKTSGEDEWKDLPVSPDNMHETMHNESEDIKTSGEEDIIKSMSDLTLNTSTAADIKHLPESNEKDTPKSEDNAILPHPKINEPSENTAAVMKPSVVPSKDSISLETRKGNASNVNLSEQASSSKHIAAGSPLATVGGGFNYMQSMVPEQGVSPSPSTEVAEEKKMLEQYVAEVEQRLATKHTLRQQNQDVSGLRPDESHFSKLDSSLKKNTAFVRKLKTFTCSQLDSLLKDMCSLNLTKYVSEAASAIVEAKLKMNDVIAAVELCNALHHTYAEFSSHLLENWQRFLSIKKDDRAINQSKLRVDLRFYAELINIGIFTHKEGLPLLGNVLTVLVNMDREEHNNVNIILSFCRHCGEDYAGLVPRKMRLLSEQYSVTLPRSKLLTKEKQRNVKALLKDYYGSLMKHVMKEHQELQEFERQNKKILQTRGELSGERKEKWENLKSSYDRLYSGMSAFAEILDEDVPILPEDEYLKDEDMRMIGTSDGEETGFVSTIWEDEEEQRFYEYLTDMKEFLPSITVKPPEPVSEISEEALDAEAEEIEETVSEVKDDEEEPSPPEPDDIEELESVISSSNKILMESFLTHLPNCVNREMIDSSAVEFVMNLNTKYNRKKLVKMLFSVPRTRLDVLPFYARFVATLHPVVPDVAMELGQFLKQDFKFHVRKKIKVVRFIGELVKFRMYSKIEALYCLKLLLHDFTHHHIEMCCSLLESCGRFLFRNIDSHQRTKVYLEQMMRKKSVTALDSRYVTMIENAYYYVDPPDTAPFVKKERPVMHEFIRKILYQDLMKANTDKVLRLMRKLDWENIDLAEYAVKCLTMAHNVKYYNIRCLASLLAGLVTHQETVGTHVVDGVMEDIRLGMEVNLPKYSQRRVAMIKYLGELYNYRLVESSDIFKVLYSLISFGVTMNPAAPSILDPPEHLFRIRLVCVLLETCGQYFNNGVSKQKLDYYFTYFQRYFWFKYEDKIWTTDNPFPVGIHYLFRDTLTSLRPKLQLFVSYEEANQAVRQMQIDLAPILSDHVPWLFGGGATEPENVILPDGTCLGTIVEAASEGDDDTGVESEIADITEGETETEESWSLDGRPVKMSLKGDGEENEGAEEDDEEGCQALSEFEDGEGEGDAEQEWGGASTSPSPQSQGDEPSLEAVLPHGPTHVECPEDEDFLSAFDRMVSDNIQDRMRETVKPQQVDISVPIHIKSSSKKTYEQLQETRVEEKSTMNFVLMAQRPVVMNLNRERRHKYQHPKGAPDADLIFGPKKMK
ncbi:Regulator of nonsense transcripts 2 [Blattella germanica]|nr:Regulator of nonsense transcripts 2 [Blattella germanica]